MDMLKKQIKPNNQVPPESNFPIGQESGTAVLKTFLQNFPLETQSLVYYPNVSL